MDWPGTPLSSAAPTIAGSGDWPGTPLQGMPGLQPVHAPDPGPPPAGGLMFRTETPGKLLGDGIRFDTGDVYYRDAGGQWMPTNNETQMALPNPQTGRLQVFEKASGIRPATGGDIGQAGLDIAKTIPGIGSALQLPQASANFWAGKPGAVSDMSNTLSGLALTGPIGAPPGAIGSGFTRPGGAASTVEAATPPLAAAAERSPGQLLQSADSIGLQIPRYIASDNLIENRMAAAARELPGPGGAQVTQSAKDVASGLGDRVKMASQALGAGSQEVAGGEARDALAGWIKDGVNGINDRTYSAVDKLVDPTVTRPLTSTADAAQAILAKRSNASIPGQSGAVNSIMEAVTKPSGLNYQGVKDLRSYIGEMTSPELVAQGIGPKEKSALYSALTQDLQGTVQAAGGDRALAAWQRANDIAQLAFDRRDQLTRIIGADANASPVQVYSHLMAMAGSKQGADIATLAAARRAMGSEAWNEIASAKLANMGRDAAGTFSPDRFRTEYGNLSPNARDLLFRGTAKAGEALPIGSTSVSNAVRAINDLATAYHEKLTEYSNTSRSAGTLMNAATAMALYSHPFATISGIAGGKLLADMVTRPMTAKMVEEFATSAKANARNPTPANARAYRIAATNLGNVMQSSYAPPTGPLGTAPVGPPSPVLGSLTDREQRISPVYAKRPGTVRPSALTSR